jgi:8-oxo-dGTP pyrophosphatase MutT (NUDIX family)
MFPLTEPLVPARPRITVAAIVEDLGRFLCVEERTKDGRTVINQPAGHLERGETLSEAVIRETLEETGWQVRPTHVVGCYLWGPAAEGPSYFRIAYAASPVSHDPNAILDAVIERALWLTADELAQRGHSHRTPLVMRCVNDYLNGENYSLSLITEFPA